MIATPGITGIGLLTPLGASADETWCSLLNRNFIRDHSRAKLTVDDGPPRAAQLAIAAAREAIAHAAWNGSELSDAETALVIGTSKGPVESWIGDGARVVEPASLSYGLAELATVIGGAVGHGAGPRSTLSAACSSGLHALIHATLLLRSGVARRALVVSVEASVHPLFISSFKRLGVLPAEGIGCRPFDLTRDGFLLSEAAAALCLENDPANQALARIDEIAIGGDAAHLTGADPAGRTLREMLRRVVDGRGVDLVHAHATGTKQNDPIELAAIEATIAKHSDPLVYSHKGALGHSLGAAGLVAVVLNCLMHQAGQVPPNVQTHQPLPTHLTISRNTEKRCIHRSIALAAGFGGAVAAVSLVGNPKR
jgi:3-oxoacyl-[acyl-carrier-protein] synthase II